MELLCSILLKKSGLAALTDKGWSSFNKILKGLEITGNRWLAFGPIEENTEFDFDSLIATVPEWPLGGDGRPFVLFIDEANELSSLAASDSKV